ncbi:MAG: glycerate kinase [Oscillospiraceae bacterium]|nr:glycerate kinase [Oscillospiraceae bacterium]
MNSLNRIIVIPDSFKSGITSVRFCELSKIAINNIFPDTEVITIPVGDGGEGTVYAFLSAVGGEKIHVSVKNPFFEDMEAYYGMLPNKTAVIEMAVCAGLPLANGRANPLITSTYGVGQLISHAIGQGCTSIILAIGGSATNDAGCGMASALGVRFFDEQNHEFIPTGGTLHKIKDIDMKDFKLAVPVTAMCDIDNPLYGTQGAAHVFAPQKGADSTSVELLDEGLRHFAKVVKTQLFVDVQNLSGGGAAGGLGAGAVCFLKADLKMGIDVVLDAVSFDSLLADTDLVITGEGKIDTQSLRGKAVVGIAKRAKEKNVPVIAIVGDIGDNIEEAYEMGISAIFSINRVAIPREDAKKRSESDLGLTLENILRFIRSLS